MYASILILFAILPTTTKTICNTFVCESFDDGSSLLAVDYHIDCTSSRFSE